MASSSDSSSPARIILADLRLRPEAEEFVLAANREANIRGHGVRVIYVKTNVMQRNDLEELVQASLGLGARFRTYGSLGRVFSSR